MLNLRGITISVNYGSLLRTTLARNMRHLTECVVVTSPDDAETQEVARSVPGVRLHVTDAFTRHGARFNKGLGMEEGFDVLGRHGWLLIWDADILFPDEMPLPVAPNPGTLYGCRRRMLADPLKWTHDLDWRACPPIRDGGPIGFFQLFHADAASLQGKRPWYDVTFTHAGGGDAYFMDLFGPAHRQVLPFDVLHLGENDVNWFGRDAESRDIMAAFVTRNGWHRAAAKHDPTAVDRVGEIVERVSVPGYEPSGYELPFVRRAKRAR